MDGKESGPLDSILQKSNVKMQRDQEAAPLLQSNIIPTGSLSLDLALGVGGIPRGRIVEIYGPESSGKTTLCQHFIAEAQRLGGICAFIDMEHALDAAYAARCGVDLGELYLSQPETGEQALEIADALIRSGDMSMVVVDSVAALVPRDEFEADMGASFLGLHARLMSQALRKLSKLVRQTSTVLVFTNQLRFRPGVVFGGRQTTTGGDSLKHYASIRLGIQVVDAIQANEQRIGSRVKVKVKKNKLAAPFAEAQFDVLYERGISRDADVLDIATKRGIVERESNWFVYGNLVLGQRREEAIGYLIEHPDVALGIEQAIRRNTNFLDKAVNAERGLF